MNNFEGNIKKLVRAYQLFFRTDLNLNDKQSPYHIGGAEVYNGENKFKVSTPDLFQHSKRDLHPFQKLINVLLIKKIITTTDSMTSLAEKIVQNQHLVDEDTVKHIKAAAHYAGNLIEETKPYLELLKATYLDFIALVEKNKRQGTIGAALVDGERNPEKKFTPKANPESAVSPTLSERAPSPSDSAYRASPTPSESDHTRPSTPRSTEVQNPVLSGDKQLLAALRQRAEATDQNPNTNSQAKLKAIFQNLKAGQYADTIRFEPDKLVQQEKLAKKKTELQSELVELKNEHSSLKEKRNEAYQNFYAHEESNPKRAEIDYQEFFEYAEKYKECKTKIKELEAVLNDMEEEEQDDNYIPDSPKSSY